MFLYFLENHKKQERRFLEVKKYIILLALIVLGISSAAKAQVKQISSDEFYTVSGKAYRLSSERTRRAIIKTEELENGTVVASMTKTEEEIVPDKTRVLIVERKGNVENISEIITIGSKIYERKDNGQWTVRDMRNGEGRGAGSAGMNCVQFTEEESSVDGVLARKLSNLSITRKENVLTFSNSIGWIDQQGLLLRSEYVRGLLEPRIETFRSVAAYEYEPKDLKIEAPIK